MSTSEAISMSDFGRAGGKGAKAAISLAVLGSACCVSAASERRATVVPVCACGGERTATVVPVSVVAPFVVSPRSALKKLGSAGAAALAPVSAGTAGSVARPACTLRERDVVAGVCAGAFAEPCTLAEVSACDMMKA